MLNPTLQRKLNDDPRTRNRSRRKGRIIEAIHEDLKNRPLLLRRIKTKEWYCQALLNVAKERTIMGAVVPARIRMRSYELLEQYFLNAALTLTAVKRDIVAMLLTEMRAKERNPQFQPKIDKLLLVIRRINPGSSPSPRPSTSSGQSGGDSVPNLGFSEFLDGIKEMMQVVMSENKKAMELMMNGMVATMTTNMETTVRTVKRLFDAEKKECNRKHIALAKRILLLEKRDEVITHLSSLQRQRFSLIGNENSPPSY